MVFLNFNDPRVELRFQGYFAQTKTRGDFLWVALRLGMVLIFLSRFRDSYHSQPLWRSALCKINVLVIVLVLFVIRLMPERWLGWRSRLIIAIRVSVSFTCIAIMVRCSLIFLY